MHPDLILSPRDFSPIQYALKHLYNPIQFLDLPKIQFTIPFVASVWKNDIFFLSPCQNITLLEQKWPSQSTFKP